MRPSYFSRCFAAFVVAMVVGIAVAIFSAGLHTVTQFLSRFPQLLLGLPLAGLFLAWLKTKDFFKNLESTQDIEMELRNSKSPIQPRLAPAIVLMTWISHLFGASVGREMIAVQVGASLAEALHSVLKKIQIHVDRELVLKMGVAAGFSAIFYSPLAAVIFVFEISRSSAELFKRSFAFVLICAVCSYFWIMALPVTHLSFPKIDFQIPNGMSWLFFSSALVAFAVAYDKLAERIFSFARQLNPWLLHFFGGLSLASFIFFFKAEAHMGLSLELLQRSFSEVLPTSTSLTKAFLTILSNASGFKGGEVVPLMVTGASLGSNLSEFLHLPLGECAAVGVAVLFSYRLNCPWAGLAWVLTAFSWPIALLAALPLTMVWLIRRWS